MARTAISTSAAVCAALLLLAPAVGATQAAQHEHEHSAAKAAQHEHEHGTAKATAEMPAQCKAMMATHEKMSADVKAADQRLDGLVAKMSTAAGPAKVEATAAVVAELVTQRKTMREGTMKMDDEMMRHMMAHMQAGPESAENCPMMKGGAMKGMAH